MEYDNYKSRKVITNITRKEAEDFVKKIICYTLGTTIAVGILIGVILSVIFALTGKW